ncbi:MAG: LysR family transcriptional regulator [Polyangiaceae bacterium]
MSRIDSQPRLESRDLQFLQALARAGSTAHAAASLHLTQSAVSRALGQLEAKLQVKLFERRARGLQPTPATERLLRGAGPLLAALLELEQTALARALPRRVRLVCECYTAYRWLPSTLARLRQRLPELCVEIAVEHTSAPLPALLDGRIDLALLTTSEVEGSLLQRALFSDEIVFVLSSAHPLAARAELSRDDLSSSVLISSPSPDEERRWFMSQVFGRRRPKLDMLHFPLTEAVVDAARAGMGVAVMSEWIASGYLGGSDLVVKRLASGRLQRPWRIAYRREFADAARLLASALAGAPPRVFPASSNAAF